MPRSLMHTVRGYKSGKYFESTEYDPNVMTTRSGLSIRTVPSFSSKPVCSVIPPVLQINETPEISGNKKKRSHSIVKYKSLSYMSFVTRFYLCLRVPELDLAGVNPRETLQYIESLMSDSECESERSDDTDCDYEDESETSTHQVDEEENANNNGDVSSQGSCRDFDDSTNVQMIKGLDASPGFRVNDRVLSIDLGQATDSQNDTESILSSTDYIGNDDVFLPETDLDSNTSSKEVYVDVENSPMSFRRSDSDSDSTCSSSMSSLDEGGKRLLQMQLDLMSASGGKKLINCEHCDKAFALVSAYSSHLKTHTRLKNKCDICGKSFSRSWLLKGHLRTHTGERPFPCPHPDCDKAFADKSNLRSHLLIHTVTSKNYSCKKCGRAFAQKRYLHKHMLEVCRVI